MKTTGIRISVLLFAFAVALTMNTSPALAKKDGGGMPGGFDKGEKKGWEGDEPPGWSKGEKNGWDDTDMPLGLTKKVDGTKKEKVKKEKKKKR